MSLSGGKELGRSVGKTSRNSVNTDAMSLWIVTEDGGEIAAGTKASATPFVPSSDLNASYEQMRDGFVGVDEEAGDSKVGIGGGGGESLDGIRRIL